MIFKLFRQINRKYFNSELPRIHIQFSKNLPHNIAGRFKHQFVVTESFDKPLKIILNPVLKKNPKLLKNVLIHELIHYHECLFNPPSSSQWNRANNILETEGLTKQSWNKIREILKPYHHSTYFIEQVKKLNNEHKELNVPIKICFLGT